MTLHYARLLPLLVCFAAIPCEAQAGKTPAQTGVVTSVSQGVLYIGGFAHSIATVKTNVGIVRVAVSAMGTPQPLQVGESLSFAGPSIIVDTAAVINTRDGFIYRPAEKSLAEYMADQMRTAQIQAQVQAQAQTGKDNPIGIPDAVPTFTVESPAQIREAAARRRTDLLLALLSVIVAILTVERVPHLIVAPLRWIRARVAARKPVTDDVAG